MLSEELDAEITRRFSKNPPRRNFTTLNSILTDMIQHESAIISVTRQHIMDTTGLEDSNVLRYLANIEHIITEEDLDLLPELSKETPSLCTFEYLEQANELIGLPLTDECLQKLIDKEATAAQLRYWTYLRNYYVSQLPTISDIVIERWESKFEGELRALEYKYGNVWGVWEDELENSFFVVNINDDPDFYENIFSFSVGYNQDSFIYFAKVAKNGSCEGYFVNTNNNVREGNTDIEKNKYLGFEKATRFSEIIFGNNTIEIKEGTSVKNKFILCGKKPPEGVERWIDRTAVGKARKKERTPKETKLNASAPFVMSHPHKRRSYINDTLMTPQERYERAERRRQIFARAEHERLENYKQWLRQDLEQKRLARRAAR